MVSGVVSLVGYQIFSMLFLIQVINMGQIGGEGGVFFIGVRVREFRLEDRGIGERGKVSQGTSVDRAGA